MGGAVQPGYLLLLNSDLCVLDVLPVMGMKLKDWSALIFVNKSDGNHDSSF